MQPLAVPVVATLADPGAAKNLRGVGTVEKQLDADTYVIATAKGRVTVTTLDGQLEVNSTVAISRQGNRLTIQQVPSSDPEPVSSSDTYAGANPAAAAAGDKGAGGSYSPGSQPVKLDKEDPEGFVRFGSARDAARWLEAQGAAPDQATRAVSGAGAGRPVVVYTYQAADGATDAVVLDDASAAAELQHVVAAELQSPLWQQLDGQALEQVLQARGAVTVDQLIAIDQALTSSGGGGTSPAGIPDQTGRVQQWLAVALDAQSAMDSVAELSPVSGAADIVALYQQIVDGTDSGLQSILPGLTQETLAAPPAGSSTAIPDAVGLLGLNFEQQLLNGDAESAIDGSVKGQLYRILADAGDAPQAGVPTGQQSESAGLQAAPDNFPLTPRDITALAGSLEKSAQSEALRLDDLRSSLLARIDSALAPVTSSIGALATRLEQPTTPPEISQAVQSVSSGILAAVEDVPSIVRESGIVQPPSGADVTPAPQAVAVLQNIVTALKAWVDGLPAASESPQSETTDSPTESVQTGATTAAGDTGSSFVQRVDQAVGRIAQEAAGFNRSAAMPDVQRQLDPLVQSVQETLRSLSQTIARNADTLSQNMEPLLGGQDAATGSQSTAAQKQVDLLVSVFAKETQELVQNAVRSIRGQIEQVAGDVANASSKDAQTATRIVQEIRDLATLATSGRQTEQPAPGAPAVTAAEHLRQQVETALGRIESLQVLARPTQTSDGQQQVLALPMRIDGEWKEVTIRLLRRHAGKGGGKGTGQGYGVQIAVSPSVAGSMAIAMDYRPGTPLNVHMNFAVPQSRRWFEENRADLTAALRNTGFAAVSLQFGKLTEKNPTAVGIAGTTDGGGGKIDIKV